MYTQLWQGSWSSSPVSLTARAHALLSFPVTSESHPGQSCGGYRYQAPDGSGLWSLSACRRKGSPDTQHCSEPAPAQPRRSEEALQSLPTVQVGCPRHNSTHVAALPCSPILFAAQNRHPDIQTFPDTRGSRAAELETGSKF